MNEKDKGRKENPPGGASSGGLWSLARYMSGERKSARFPERAAKRLAEALSGPPDRPFDPAVPEQIRELFPEFLEDREQWLRLSRLLLEEEEDGKLPAGGRVIKPGPP